MSKPFTHTRVIRRSGTVEGNLVRPIDDPKKRQKFLTLTNRPANERPFVVVRSEQEEANPAATPRARIVRAAKRSDNPVLSVSFPADYTEDTVKGILAEYSMDDYRLDTAADGTFVAMRADLQSIADVTTTAIRLNSDGVTALLNAAEHQVKRAETKNNLTLVAYEFDAKRFDGEKVNAWLSQNSVDSPQVSVENPSGDAITVKRSDIEEGTETRRVELEDGVFAVVARSEACCLPDQYAAVINESAYGSYGWGHLDFSASMADLEYCQVIDKANSRLSSVIDHITRYCSLPLDARKQLVTQALTQYGEFVGSVIDALPRQVMLLVTRAADATKESTTMSKAETVAAPDTPVTRAELAEMITAGVTAAMAAQRGEPATAAVATTPAAADGTGAAAPVVVATTTETDAQRAEAAAAVAAAAPVVAAPAVVAAVAAPAVEATVTRADIAAAIVEAMAPLTAQITEMNNTVIVRSDKGDRTVTALGTNVKRTETEIFSGAIPGLPRK